MRTLKLTLAYDGTAYAGWQVQPGKTTVQGTLEAALSKVTGHFVRVLASGRTDAGVHARGQVVGFQTGSELAPDVLQKALNAVLPPDVAVLDVAEAAEGFHAIRDAVRKRYRYVIHDGPVRDVFGRAYAWHCRRRLDDEAMHRAAQVLSGTHDFSSFETSGAPRVSSVRTVSHISVGRAGDCPVFRPTDATSQNRADRKTGLSPSGDDSSVDEHFLLIDVEADGFLYNMVRTIVGTLVEVGRGAEPEHWVGQVLEATDRRRAGPTAPPEGLFLMQVDY
ncbi:MAG: tRNA pseudouridine(38-40) synthase TruA [Pirellulales bacterium]|nr:tRNA pseudouridine(38-40) synthase TruA [Pirellulales bacterium]